MANWLMNIFRSRPHSKSTVNDQAEARNKPSEKEKKKEEKEMVKERKNEEKKRKKEEKERKKEVKRAKKMRKKEEKETKKEVKRAEKMRKKEEKERKKEVKKAEKMRKKEGKIKEIPPSSISAAPVAGLASTLAPDVPAGPIDSSSSSGSEILSPVESAVVKPKPTFQVIIKGYKRNDSDDTEVYEEQIAERLVKLCADGSYDVFLPVMRAEDFRLPGYHYSRTDDCHWPELWRNHGARRRHSWPMQSSDQDQLRDVFQNDFLLGRRKCLDINTTITFYPSTYRNQVPGLDNEGKNQCYIADFATPKPTMPAVSVHIIGARNVTIVNARAVQVSATSTGYIASVNMVDEFAEKYSCTQPDELDKDWPLLIRCRRRNEPRRRYSWCMKRNEQDLVSESFEKDYLDLGLRSREWRTPWTPRTYADECPWASTLLPDDADEVYFGTDGDGGAHWVRCGPERLECLAANAVPNTVIAARHQVVATFPKRLITCILQHREKYPLAYPDRPHRSEMKRKMNYHM